MSYRFADRMGKLQASAIREILKFTSDPTVISFAAGNPAAEAIPTKEWAEIAADVLAKNPVQALQYSISEGYPPLRKTLTDYLRNKLNIGSKSDNLIITSGAQQAVELSCKVMCNEGDTIICETPSFIGSLNAFKSFKTNLVGIPMEQDGIDVTALEQALKANPNTKLIYLIPNFQNPTGITMSFEKRKRCYELAVEHNVLILEDNPYGDLRYEGEDIPSIKSLDTTGNVIYCGSFSKVISAGMRVGYMCANEEVVQKVVVVKQTSDVHTNILSQMVCDRFINEYDYAQHIDRIKDIYKRKGTLMYQRALACFNPQFKLTRPTGGLFMWCTVPDSINADEFCLKAVQNKVAVVPGTAFLVGENEVNHGFRLNFSTPTDEQIIEGIKILGELSNRV